MGGVHKPFRVVVEGHNPTRQLCRRQFNRQQFLQPVEMLRWVPGVARRVVLRLPDPSIIRVRCKSMHSYDAEIIVRSLKIIQEKKTYSTVALLSSCKICIGYSAGGGALVTRDGSRRRRERQMDIMRRPQQIGKIYQTAR